MNWRHVVRFVLPGFWTFLPIYGVEKLADFYFLVDNTPAFYTMSGWRLELFIIFTLAGSIAAGVLIQEVWKAAAVEGSALVAVLASFFVLCDPRVCFSAGPENLEPLRMGFFLGSVAISGVAMGVALRHRPDSKSAQLLAGFFGFAALGYYPVIFTFAGTRLLPPLHPWDVAAVLAITAYPVSVAASLTLGPRKGFLLPLASLAVLFAISVGIALPNVESLVPVVALMTASTGIAAAVGSITVATKRSGVLAHRSGISSLYVIGLAVVLSMMLLAVPDAVNGVVPPNGGNQSAFSMGVPVYAGAFMDGAPGHALGAEVTVDFAGTNLSSIQGDNFLSAGMGIHSAGCCVDGIDYSYRFDVYLFRGGGVSLAAAAWEVCDDNAACGGHSWKVLMFLDSRPLDAAMGDNLSLRMVWGQGPAGGEVEWSYSVGGGGFTNYTSFAAPRAENPSFNTGVLVGGTIGPQQNASYFFQFGIMSRYPIGHAGWTVTLYCPALLDTGWRCIDHAKTLTGNQSYWKIFWRWGEDYNGVSMTSGRADEMRFVYSSASTPSYLALW
jgi:hypothetical protein